MKIKNVYITGLILSFSIPVFGQTTIQLRQKGMAALGNWENVTRFEYETRRINIDQWQGYDKAGIL